MSLLPPRVHLSRLTGPTRFSLALRPGRVLPSLLLMGAVFAAGPPSVHLAIPPIKQPYKLCLVASVSMVLGYWGADISPAAIAREVPLYKDGTTGLDLKRFVESRGFRGFLIQPELRDLFSHLDRQRPLVVGLPGRGGIDHAMVLIGYDESVVWLNDPATGEEISRSQDAFEKDWKENQRWTFLILPLQPGEKP